MLKEFVEIHKDVGLAYFVEEKTKAITGIIELKKLNLDKVLADGIEVKVYG